MELVSTNLFPICDNGHFETDPATWGIALDDLSGDVVFTRTRSDTEAYEQNYSLRGEVTYMTVPLPQPYSRSIFFEAGLAGILQNNKKYLVRAFVKVDAVSPIGPDTKTIRIMKLGGNYSILAYKNTSVAAAKSQWVEVSMTIETGVLSGYERIALDFAGDTSFNLNGVMYIDQFELFEYIDGGLSLSKDPIPVEFATAFKDYPNFRFEVDIKMQDETSSATFAKVCTVKGFPDTAGFFQFEAQKILHDYLSPDLPAFNQAVISECTKILRGWKASVREFYGDPVNLKSEYDTEVNKVLMGGLSFLDFPGSDFYGWQKEGGRFLTWQPDNKVISPDQQEYLYYCTIGRRLFNVHLNVKAYFDDGTDQTAEAMSQTINADVIIIVPVGPSQIALDVLFPDKTVVKYTIWLSGSDPEANKSEERTYIIDRDYYRCTKHFLYLNSLGAFETLRCTGNAEKENRFDRLSGKRILPASYSPDDRQFFSYGTKNRPFLKANTGHLYPSWKEHLQEFYQSEYVYEVVAGRFIPIELNTEKLKLPDFIDRTHFDEFEYRYCHENHAYSKLR